MKNKKRRRASGFIQADKFYKQKKKRTENIVEHNTIKKFPSNVSDHAIVRYIQRRDLVDVKDIINEIQDIMFPSRTLGDGIYHRDGLAVVVKNGIAVTVWTKEFAHKHSQG